MDDRYYDREKLYQEVWEEAVEKVAERYGVSGVAIAKTCRKLNVPLPGRGYWAKHRVGKAPKRPPLPEMDNPPKILRQSSRKTAAASVKAEQQPEPERLRPDVYEMTERLARAELLPENTIAVPETVGKLHPLVEALHPKHMKRKTGASTPWYRYSDKPRQGHLSMQVDDERFDRAARIMTTFLTALEARGYAVKVEYTRYDRNETSVSVLGHRIRFRLRQQRKRRKLRAGEDGASYRTYMDEPTDILVFMLPSLEYTDLKDTWRDSKTKKLEDQLNEIIATMLRYAAYEEELHARLQKEEEERAVREAEERREEYRDLREEARKWKLREEAARWQEFRRLQDYLQAVVAERDTRRSGLLETGFDEWITWANEYLASIHPFKQELPTVNVPDSVIEKVDSHWFHYQYPKLSEEDKKPD